MPKPVLVARLRVGDVEDPVLYAGFIISDWEKGPEAQALKKYNLSPTMWNLSQFDPNFMSQSINLWCEEYEPEDLALARLSGILEE